MKIEAISPLLRALRHEVSKKDANQQARSIAGELSSGGFYHVKIDDKIMIHFTTLPQQRDSGYIVIVEPAMSVTDDLFVNVDMLDPLISQIGISSGLTRMKLQSDILEAINTLAIMECQKAGLAEKLGIMSISTHDADCWSNSYTIEISTNFGIVPISLKQPSQVSLMPLLHLHPDDSRMEVFRPWQRTLKTADHPDPLTAMKQCALLAKIGITQIISDDEYLQLNSILDKAA